MKNALKYLKLALDKTEIAIEYIHKDNDWDNLREDIDFKNLLLNY